MPRVSDYGFQSCPVCDCDVVKLPDSTRLPVTTGAESKQMTVWMDLQDVINLVPEEETSMATAAWKACPECDWHVFSANVGNAKWSRWCQAQTKNGKPNFNSLITRCKHASRGMAESNPELLVPRVESLFDVFVSEYSSLMQTNRSIVRVVAAKLARLKMLAFCRDEFSKNVEWSQNPFGVGVFSTRNITKPLLRAALKAQYDDGLDEALESVYELHMCSDKGSPFDKWCRIRLPDGRTQLEALQDTICTQVNLSCKAAGGPVITQWKEALVEELVYMLSWFWENSHLHKYAASDSSVDVNDLYRSHVDESYVPPYGEINAVAALKDFTKQMLQKDVKASLKNSLWVVDPPLAAALEMEAAKVDLRTVFNDLDLALDALLIRWKSGKKFVLRDLPNGLDKLFLSKVCNWDDGMVKAYTMFSHTQASGGPAALRGLVELHEHVMRVTQTELRTVMTNCVDLHQRAHMRDHYGSY